VGSGGHCGEGVYEDEEEAIDPKWLQVGMKPASCVRLACVLHAPCMRLACVLHAPCTPPHTIRTTQIHILTVLVHIHGIHSHHTQPHSHTHTLPIHRCIG
jgi:hypothetical protein